MFKYLRFGYVVENPVFWKRVQLYVTILGTVFPLLAVFVPVLQVAIDKNVIAETLAAVATVNVYLTAATTDKIGL
jgi:uncharacterized membrane protein